MLFTHVGRVIAVLAVVLGAFLMFAAVIDGFGPVMGTEVETGEAVTLFYPVQALMEGVKYVLFGITLGVVTEINSAVNRMSRDRFSSAATSRNVCLGSLPELNGSPKAAVRAAGFGV